MGLDPDSMLVLEIGLALAFAVMAPVYLRARRREKATEAAQQEAIRYGLDQPVSLHPIVDPDRCIGVGNCVKVCPEGVIGFRDGQAVAVSPARCIGHGLCERACPMDAIRLVFGTAERGVDLPRVQDNFETNVEGIYIVGELGGMGLVANAFEQGRQCIEGILREAGKGPDGVLDLAIIGCGPAGLSSSLNALEAGLSFVTIEREDIGGAVRHYPRKKVVMTRPVKVPGWGKIPFREITKEELIDTWETIVRETGLEVRTQETVTGVVRRGPHDFEVSTSGGTYRAARVILAIGRRGVPRKMGVPGEAAANVYYSLRDPEGFQEQRILVVGGGDSAVEAALALSDQPGAEVRLSYRGHAFRRIKPKNHERIEQAESLGKLEVLWNTQPLAIESGRARLGRGAEVVEVPADDIFVFIGGELPTPFLNQCGIELETHFGAP